MKSIVVDGKEFVKASVAAKEHGYTNDYIGQLCRASKVEAELVGRTWYVCIESLLKHRKGRYRSSQKKTKEEMKKVLAAVETPQGPDFPRYYNRLVSNTNIEYTPDDTVDLIPAPKKIVVESEEEIAEKPQELEVITAGKNEEEYYLDTVYDEKPKSGILTIVEDETEAPVELGQIPATVNVHLVDSKPTKTERIVHHIESQKKQPKLRGVNEAASTHRSKKELHTVQPSVHQSHASAIPSILAPLSVSLLAGLAVAMLMVGLSWQFQSDDSGHSETYKVNMSSLMHQKR